MENDETKETWPWRGKLTKFKYFSLFKMENYVKWWEKCLILRAHLKVYWEINHWDLLECLSSHIFWENTRRNSMLKTSVNVKDIQTSQAD